MDTPEGWTVTHKPLPEQVLGEVHWPTRTITIDPRQPAAAARSTLAHELEHIRRGPLPADPVLAAREELVVEKVTARSLISVHALGEALAESDDPRHAAELLDVDPDLLIARLAWLDPTERAYLRRRLSQPDQNGEPI